MASDTMTTRKARVKTADSILGVHMHGERGYGETKRSAETDLAQKVSFALDGCYSPAVSCYRDHLIVTWQDRGSWGYIVRSVADLAAGAVSHCSCMLAESTRAATLAAARRDVDGRFPASPEGGAA